MDLLHKRYASPFSLLDNLIVHSMFHTFIDQLMSKVDEEHTEQMNWEFYLHKVFDKSYQEFKNEMGNQVGKPKGDMKEAEKQEIIVESQNMLNGFSPKN